MARLRLWPLLAALSWLLFFILAASAPQYLEYSIPAQLVTLVCGLAILAATLYAAERPRWPAWARWLFFIAGAAAVLIPFALNLHAPIIRALASLGLLAVALPLGYWIGDRMEKVTNLIPLAVAMSMADIFSVYQGPSRHVADKINSYQAEVADKVSALGNAASPEAVQQAAASIRAPLVDYLVVHLPVAGTHQTLGVLGVGDFIVLAFLFRAAWVHRLNARGVFWAALGATLLALIMSNTLDMTLPALPVIAAGTIGYLWVSDARLKRIDRQEVLLSIGVAVLFAALMLARWLLGVMHV